MERSGTGGGMGPVGGAKSLFFRKQTDPPGRKRGAKTIRKGKGKDQNMKRHRAKHQNHKNAPREDTPTFRAKGNLNQKYQKRKILAHWPG